MNNKCMFENQLKNIFVVFVYSIQLHCKLVVDHQRMATYSDHTTAPRVGKNLFYEAVH